jgi:hypothetical protein
MDDNESASEQLPVFSLIQCVVYLTRSMMLCQFATIPTMALLFLPAMVSTYDRNLPFLKMIATW